MAEKAGAAEKTGAAEEPSAAEEFGGAARLISDGALAVADSVQRMHYAISRRPLRAAGAAGLPVRLLHDGISGLVHGSVRSGIAAGGVLAQVLGRAAGARRPRGTLLDTGPGQLTTGVLNGAFGARARVRGDLLPDRMTVRVHGAAVPLDPAALAAAFPAPSGTLLVFLHGLIETERWWFGAPDEDGSPRPDFGTRLAADLGGTPVYLRYNSGRHISDNGAELVRLLAELTAAWPVPPTEIVLIGHSMGGLVARSALHQARPAAPGWLPLVRTLVCLGAPHTGAPLERAANLAGAALRSFPESAPLGELLGKRSSGVKDLRYGYLHERQWLGNDPDSVPRLDEPVPTVLPERVRQYFLAVTVARRLDSPLARRFGDGLVTPGSATGPGQRAERAWIGGMHHFHLLRRDEVYAQLLAWLREAQPGTDSGVSRQNG